MKTLITVKKLHSIVAHRGCPVSGNENIVASFNAEMMRLGFVMTKNLHEIISTYNREQIVSIYEEVIPVLKKMKGDDVKYRPMYPNFPQQVMEASDLELFLNAIVHYWSEGTWLPEYEEVQKEIGFEDVKFIQIDACTESDVGKVFTTLLSANTSLSKEDRQMVEWFLNSNMKLEYPKAIPFKENLCLVASHLIESGKSIQGCVSNATDVLRVMAHLSGGDISLAANTKFKSLPKSKRRKLAYALEGVINEDDIARHKNKWVKAFHNLHIGDFVKACPKTCELAFKARNDKLETFNSMVEGCISNGKSKDAAILLSHRPGDFARRLDHLLRIGDPRTVVTSFNKVADKVSTRVLCQLMGHFNNRDEESRERVVFPKGSMTSAIILKDKLPLLTKPTITRVRSGLQKTLIDRFSELDELGKVWIDPALANCPIPMQQRSASEGLIQVARGTRLPITEKDVLRLFIYWKGQDIDLSASLHDENFNMVERIAYTNLRSSKYQAFHSGDIVQAPNGAAEFIDINMDQAMEHARYIVMNVLVYCGPNFADHEICYAGWMTRDKPAKNATFDPKTVEQKIDLRAASRNAIPVVFDLKERKGIWCDLVTKRNAPWETVAPGRWNRYGNNVENNRASIQDTLKSIVNLGNKPNLYQLFEAHAHARGELVESKEEADTVFSIDEGITPFDIDKISAEFLA